MTGELLDGEDVLTSVEERRDEAAAVLETVLGCEGLVLDLDALWARIDDLES